MVYGSRFLKEEYGYYDQSLVLTESQADFIYEYMVSQLGEEVLCEAHFTKKQLQDPNTLKQLLKKLDNTEYNIHSLYVISLLLSFVEGVVLGIVTKSFIIGFISSFSILFGKADLYIKKIEPWVYKYREEEVDKLEKQCQRLKETSLKMNNTEGKEIASNCDKLLKEIDKRRKKQDKDKYNKNLERCKKVYLSIINGNTWTLLDYVENYNDIIYILDKCKIKDYFDKKCKQYDQSELENVNDIWSLEEDDDYEIGKDKKWFPEFYSRGKIVNMGFPGDELVCIYSPKTNSFWYGYYDDVKEYKNFTDVIKYITSKDKNYKVSDYLQDDYLKLVDAQEGYFLLSEPPTGVKRKVLK